MAAGHVLQRQLKLMSLNGDVDDLLERLEACTWLMKDLGWCMLLWPVAWPAAVAAIFIEFYVILRQWIDGASTAEFIHRCAFGLWLLANATWMTFEFLFLASPQPGRTFPWFHGPLLGTDENTYWIGLTVVRSLLAADLVMLLTFYGTQAYIAAIKASRPVLHEPQDDDIDKAAGQHEQDPLVFGHISPDVYKMIFVGPWVAKDLCWTYDLLPASLFLACIVGALMLDYVRRYGGLQLYALIFWVAGNTVWVIDESWPDDKEGWPRRLGCALLFAGLVVVGFDWLIAKRKADKAGDGEMRALLSQVERHRLGSQSCSSLNSKPV